MMNGRRGEDLAQRTKQFALRIIRVYAKLPRSGAAETIGKQLLRSGTSVGAQYREAMRARSSAEFVSKTAAALQELEETSYWIELLGDAEIISASRLADLQKESNELIAILVASIKTAKRRQEK